MGRKLSGEFIVDEKTPIPITIREDCPVHSQMVDKIYAVRQESAVVENRVSVLERTIRKGFDENRKQMKDMDDKLDAFKEVLTKNSTRLSLLWAALAAAGTTAIHQLVGG